MKRFLALLVVVGLLVVCLFGGLHIGNPCPTDAADFAEHIGENGSNHLPEFGGLNGAIAFLQGIANGDVPISVYGDMGRTIVTATSSPWGPVVIIYGSSVLPTMFPTTIGYINNAIRGMQKRRSAEDVSTARSAAGCFSKALEPSGIPIQLPSTAVLAAIAGIAILGIFILGGKKSSGLPA